MADVRVASVDVDATQPEGTTFGVQLGMNNGETVAPPWNPKTDSWGGDRGHKTDITLIIEDSTGTEVVNKTKEEVVIPRNRGLELGGCNRRVTFTCSLDRTGSYNIRAKASVVREERTHTSDPVRIEVVDPSENESAEDTEAGGGDGEDADFNFGANNDAPWQEDDDDATDGDENPLPGLPDASGATLAVGAVALIGVVWIVADLS